MWLTLGRGTRRAVTVTACLAVTVGLMATASPVHAAPSGIEFSTDGITYSSVFSGSLFDEISLVVPGDTQTSTFWVRNTAGSAGFLRVVLADVVASSPAIANAVTVTTSTTGRTGSPVKLANAAPCWVLVEGDQLASGGTTRVTAQLALGDLTGATGQGETASLSIRVGMSDAAVGSLPPSSCGGTGTTIPVSGPPAVIAMTGSDVSYPLVGIGAGALGVGFFLLMAARRRRQEDA